MKFFYRQFTLLVVFLYTATGIFSQTVNFTEHIIDDAVDGTRGVYACDIDNDGDNDILAASYYDNEVTLWRNDGGTPVLFTKQIIDDNLNGALYIYAADIDDDGNIDVIASEVDAGEIAWWQNDGNNPITWTKQTIAVGFTTAHGVFACDIDDDGHTDILGTSEGLDKISWWENSGTNPIVWTEYVIGENFDGTQSVYAIDIDGDNDFDVIGAAGGDNEIALWYNEGGSPVSWSKQIIDNSFGFAHWVYATDVNGDDLPDILGAAFTSGDITCWYNDGASPVSWNKQVIDGNFYGALTVHASDLDNDDDTDIIGTNWSSDDVVWWENDGNTPVTWTKHIIDSYFNGASSIFTADIDGDTDTDIIAGADVINGPGTSAPLTWWENDLIYNETVTDYDGNVYNTIEIGEQTWLQENLKSLHYSDGTEITEVWTYDDNEANAEIYGRLYTWNGAMNYSTIEGAQGVCPDDWHVPTDAEWTELGTYLGGNNVAGGKLKSTGTELWQAPNTGATNSSGFTALPAGEYDDTHYQLLYQYAVIWSSTETSGVWCKYRYLAYNDAELHTYNYYKDFRYSVRCIKDESVEIEEQGNIEKKIKISPNPADETIFIQLPEHSNFPVKIYFCDISGKLLKSSLINSKNAEIDISALPSGMFFLRICIEGEILTEKLIKN